MFLKLSIIALGFVSLSKASLILDNDFIKNVNNCVNDIITDRDLTNDNFCSILKNAKKLRYADDNLLEIYTKMSDILIHSSKILIKKNRPIAKKLYKINSKIEDILVDCNKFPDNLRENAELLSKTLADLRYNNLD